MTHDMLPKMTRRLATFVDMNDRIPSEKPVYIVKKLFR